MTGSVILYTQADIAELLGVSRAAVINWQRRPEVNGTPTPTHITLGGVPYWDESGAKRWAEWHAERLSDRADRARLAASRHTQLARRARANARKLETTHRGRESK